MAKIIKIKNSLIEKQKSIEKEIEKQYNWIKVGNILVGVLFFIALMFWGSAVFASTTNNPQQDYNETKAKIEQAQIDMKQRQEEFKKEYNENKAKIEQGQAEVKQGQEESQKKYNETKAKIEQGKAEMNQTQSQNKISDETNKTTNVQQEIQDTKQRVLDKQANFEKTRLKIQGFLKTIFLAIIFSIGAFLNRKYRMSKINQLKNDLNRYNSGLAGEINAVQNLAQLSDDYTIINNPIITTNGSNNELDNLIIGSNGIFIVETKNYTGLIHGNINDKNWIQEKVVKNKPITKEFYSPVMQVKQHGRRINEFLRTLGYNITPETIAYFVNPDTTLSIDGISDTKIFCKKELNEMINMIESFKSDINLSETDKIKIIEAVVSSQQQ